MASTRVVCSAALSFTVKRSTHVKHIIFDITLHGATFHINGKLVSVRSIARIPYGQYNRTYNTLINFSPQLSVSFEHDMPTGKYAGRIYVSKSDPCNVILPSFCEIIPDQSYKIRMQVYLHDDSIVETPIIRIRHSPIITPIVEDQTGGNITTALMRRYNLDPIIMLKHAAELEHTHPLVPLTAVTTG